MLEIKNTEFISRLDIAKPRIYELEDESIETSQTEMETEKKKKN